MTFDEIIQVLAGFIGTLGFGVLFNVRGKRLLVGAVGGLLSWLLFILINKVVHNEPVAYFAVSVAISAYAEIMARVLKTPTTAFIITGLIPLIPGGSLYYTMAYAFESDINKFVSKAVYTLELAAALALGVITVTTIVKIINKITQKVKNDRKT